MNKLIIPAWFLLYLAGLSFAGAVLCLVVAAFFLRRGLPDDSSGAIAAAGIATILLFASIGAVRVVSKQRREPRGVPQPEAKSWLRWAALLCSLPALWGGIDCLWLATTSYYRGYPRWFSSGGGLGTSESFDLAIVLGHHIFGFLMASVGGLSSTIAWRSGWALPIRCATCAWRELGCRNCPNPAGRICRPKARMAGS